MKQEIKRVTAKLLTLVMLLTLCMVFSPTELESKAATATTITYNSYVQSYGWTGWKSNGALSGKTGESKRLEGINIKLKNKTVSGSVKYRTYVQTYGWKSWVNEGQYSGTKGESKRIEAIQIKLTGELAKSYDVYYRAHVQSHGWLAWAKNGASAGSQGLSKRIEAIQIVLVKKGASAPGNVGGIKSAKKDSCVTKTTLAKEWKPAYVKCVQSALSKDLSALMVVLDDMDSDGIPELFIQKSMNLGVNDYKENIYIYTYTGNKCKLIYSGTDGAWRLCVGKNKHYGASEVRYHYNGDEYLGYETIGHIIEKKGNAIAEKYYAWYYFDFSTDPMGETWRYVKNGVQIADDRSTVQDLLAKEGFMLAKGEVTYMNGVHDWVYDFSDKAVWEGGKCGCDNAVKYINEYVVK